MSNRHSMCAAITSLALIFSVTLGSAVPTDSTLHVVGRRTSVGSLPCRQRIPIFEELAANAEKAYMKAVDAAFDLVNLRDLMETHVRAAVQKFNSLAVRRYRLRVDRDETDQRINRLTGERDLNAEKADAFRGVAFHNRETLAEVSQKHDAAKVVADSATRKKAVAKTRFGEAEEALDTPPFSPGELERYTASKEALLAATEESGEADAVLAEFQQQVKTLKGEVTAADTKVEVFNRNIVELDAKLEKAGNELGDIEANLKQVQKDFEEADGASDAARQEYMEIIAKLDVATEKEREMKEKAVAAEAELAKGRRECRV